MRDNPAYYGRYESFALFELASIGVGALTGALDEYGDLMKSRTTIFPPILRRSEDSDYRRWYGRTLGRLSMAEAALSDMAAQWTEASRLHMLGERPFSVAENMPVVACLWRSDRRRLGSHADTLDHRGIFSCPGWRAHAASLPRFGDAAKPRHRDLV